MRTTLLSLLFLLSAFEECPDCVPGTRKATLCAPHTAEEKAGLKACAAALRKNAPAERLEALRELAALTAAHANAPSPAVVKTLARGLTDEAEEVVLGTIELLGAQHPEAVLAEYSGHVKKLAKRYKDLDKSAEKIRQRLGSSKDEAELSELEAEMAAIDRATDGISAQLGQLRDDRAVTALDTMLEQNGREATVDALAALGNVDAAEALYHHMDRYAVMFQTVGELKGTMEEAAELTGQALDVDIEEMYAAARKPVAAAHGALSRIAKAAGLEEGLPALTLEAGDAWKKWLKRNGKSLPPAFGRMQLPWDG